jgi:hypothetical protein
LLLLDQLDVSAAELTNADYAVPIADVAVVEDKVAFVVTAWAPCSEATILERAGMPYRYTSSQRLPTLR